MARVTITGTVADSDKVTTTGDKAVTTSQPNQAVDKAVMVNHQTKTAAVTEGITMVYTTPKINPRAVPVITEWAFNKLTTSI